MRGKSLVTPDDNLLEGITRRTVFDLAQEMGIEATAAKLDPNELMLANEAFLSTTAGAIVPVTRVNDRPLGNGAAGLVTSRDFAHAILGAAPGRLAWPGTSIHSLLNAAS